MASMSSAIKFLNYLLNLIIGNSTPRIRNLQQHGAARGRDADSQMVFLARMPNSVIQDVI
jgi:hypothetical protein